MDILREEILLPIMDNIIHHPMDNAFCIDRRFYTFGTFGNFISGIRDLLSSTDRRLKFVGVVANNDIETYSSILALMLEGICYVPLHPEWPEERNLTICAQCNIDLILDSSINSKFLRYHVLSTYNITTDSNSLLLPTDHVDGDNNLCILFTSGSTGTPKGVVLTRDGVAAAISSFNKVGFSITNEDRCIQYFDLSFAASIMCYVSALKNKACIFTIPYYEIKYIYFASLLEDYQISFAVIPSSLLNILKPHFDELTTYSLKTCLVTSERIDYELAYSWLDCAKNMTLYNLYGSTECSGSCICHMVDRHVTNYSANSLVPIGKPMSADTICVIVNENGDINKNGESGELCISGKQIFKGYWQNGIVEQYSPFITINYSGKLMKFYRTGDICIKDSDDNIHCLGRKDSLTKIQGFRVDMREIEEIVGKYLNKCVVCLSYESISCYQQIALFVESNTRIDKNELLIYLRSKLPNYMVPSKVYVINGIPYNNNGKINRPLLKQMITNE